jgi:hypothetical protein
MGGYRNCCPCRIPVKQGSLKRVSLNEAGRDAMGGAVRTRGKNDGLGLGVVAAT